MSATRTPHHRGPGPTRTRAVWLVRGAIACAVLSSSAVAQVAFFSRNTDTIRLPGATVLGTTATYETRILLLPSSPAGARVWNEHLAAGEDKTLIVAPTSLYGYAWPVASPNPLVINRTVTTCAWHHIAYVKDTNQERMYLDGVLVGSRSSSGSVSNATGGAAVAAVGAIRRTEGIFSGGFIGFIDTLRISNVARYSANFSPPQGDLATDANTLLLLNFSEPRGATTVTDLSGHGEHGSLTQWFSGATLPELCPSPYVCSQPASTSTCRAGSPTFVVSAVGAGPFNHRWQVEDTAAVGGWADVNEGVNAISGGRTFSAVGSQLAQLQLGPAMGDEAIGLGHFTRFRCIVTSSCGGTTSNPATLTICACLDCPADFNEDGGIDGTDAQAFFAAWSGGNCDADVNQDGGVDGADVGVFFAAWEAGGC
ncbi:MAG: hypothetical protein JSR77_04250 [Planctomycetes bacterium]|nr:hypothetical protein [Planctomycetota bacterium]